MYRTTTIVWLGFSLKHGQEHITHTHIELARAIRRHVTHVIYTHLIHVWMGFDPPWVEFTTHWILVIPFWRILNVLFQQFSCISFPLFVCTIYLIHFYNLLFNRCLIHNYLFYLIYFVFFMFYFPIKLIISLKDFIKFT